jgi:hypothetical protein
MLLPMMRPDAPDQHECRQGRESAPEAAPTARPLGTTCWLPLSPSKIPRTRSAGTETSFKKKSQSAA